MSQSLDNPLEFMEAYKLHLIDLYAIRSSNDLGFMRGHDLSHPICHDVTWILERLLGDDFVEQPPYTDDSGKIEELLLSSLRGGMLVIIQQNVRGGGLNNENNPDKDRTHWLALIGLGSMSILAESTLQDCSSINLYKTVELVDKIVNIFNANEADTYDGTKYQHDMEFMIFTRFPVNAEIIHDHIENNKRRFNVLSTSFKHGHEDVPYWSIRDELLQSYKS